jgi:hypothetical protein
MGAWLPLSALNLDLLLMTLQHTDQQRNELPPSLLSYQFSHTALSKMVHCNPRK